MELSSLLCPKELATGTYPKPGEPSQHPHPILPSSILLFSHLHLGLPSGLFPTKPLYALLYFPMHAIRHAHLTLLDMNDLCTPFLLYKQIILAPCSYRNSHCS
jgi:hypothetical protein